MSATNDAAAAALHAADRFAEAYRLMLLARRLDDREILLKRQNKIFFQVSGAGHEAIQVAAGLTLDPGRDWIFPYYRDRALCLTLGVTAEQMLLQAVGSKDDLASGGRQMPSHWSSPALRIVSASSPTGSQYLQAAGCAHASRYLNVTGEVTLVSSGEGATSEGEFWESLNAACLERLPLVYLIQDNDYAISVPVEAQTAGGSISRLVESFPGLFIVRVDGCDLPASLQALGQAVDYARSGQGPALVHATVIRPYSHSLSDDEKLYRAEAERAAEAQRDPIYRFPEWLLQQGILPHRRLQDLAHDVEITVQTATERALKALPPEPETALYSLYSPDVDPSGPEFESEPRLSGEPKTMVESINQTLRDEMMHNPNVIVFGEDVADCSRERSLPAVKGKGGVFKATYGLQKAFGSARCFNSPLAEAAIVGRAIGMALRGLKPVVEIQFFDYIWPAMMQIRDELATLRWRSHNGWAAPVVIRAAYGGYLNGGAVYHSQCGESSFTHIPGLRVILPSNALDAAGLLRTAIRCSDPVLFLEHKKLYRESYNRAADPGADYCVPFGRARIAKPGRDLTIVTFGATVQKSLLAATKIEREDPLLSLEVIDLRSLAPLDWDTVASSVRKTSRLLVVHEDVLTCGFGAEIAALAAEHLFHDLDAPVRRVAARDTWVGYHPGLEDHILPQTEDIERAALALLAH
jgi:2-oxoisovalerate dehydrogenase E1 component